MDNDMLRDVIEVEKEIQRNIEAAQQETGLWLETRKKEQEERFSREEQIILGSLLEAEERAKEEAGRKASEIIRQTEERAERLARVPDDVLKAIAARHITKILPG